MLLSDSRWKECPDNGRGTGAFIVFYKGVKIDNCTHLSGPVAQPSDKRKYNTSCNLGMALANFRIIND